MTVEIFIFMTLLLQLLLTSQQSFITSERRVSLESFVCQTTYRWSDFTLSINKDDKNSWTWIKQAFVGSSLWYRKVFNNTNFCPRLLVFPGSAIFIFIDNVKSYHLYVIRQTNDPNDTRLPLQILHIGYKNSK